MEEEAAALDPSALASIIIFLFIKELVAQALQLLLALVPFTGITLTVD